MMVSKSDPCLFVSDCVVDVCFVDDILFWSRDESYINELVAKLHSWGLLFEQEDDAAEYLGVDMTQTKEGCIKMI